MSKGFDWDDLQFSCSGTHRDRVASESQDGRGPCDRNAPARQSGENSGI
jgi:hypothetical protein